MATAQHEVALQQKRELSPAQERTEAGKFYSPHTDIYETKDAVIVAMEVPGVEKSDIDIRLDKGQLTITATSIRSGTRRSIRSTLNTTWATSFARSRCRRRSTATPSARASRTAC